MNEQPFPDGKIRQFTHGFGYFRRALRFIDTHKLWGPCVWPIIIDLFLCVVLVAFALVWADNLRDLIWAKPVGEGFWEGLKLVLWHALHVLFIILFILLTAIIFAMLGSVIASPFLDVLSERVERIVGKTDVVEPRFFRSLWYSIKDLFKILAFYAVIIGPLLFLNLVPFVGGIFYTLLSSSFAWLMLSMDFLSFPLNRRLIPFKVKWRFVWTNKWLCFGFGCNVFLLLFVPFLNLLLIPLAAVGGTLFFADLVVAGRIPREPLTAYMKPGENTLD